MVHQIGVKLRGQIQDFSGKLCSGMSKVATRFVEEMVYGIQARGSVRLSEIARSLEEKTVSRVIWAEQGSAATLAPVFLLKGRLELSATHF